MKNIKQYINEALRIKSGTNITTGPKYQYFPKNRKELDKLLDDLITERGDEADLNDIDTSKITDMSRLFADRWNMDALEDYEYDDDDYNFREFNGDISKWDVSNVKNMYAMFFSSDFDGEISKWNVSKVKDMSAMFYLSEFDGDLSKWNVSKVTTMSEMFEKSKFSGKNGDISKWNVSKVKDMGDMFANSKFNGNLSYWNVSNVIYMPRMFYNTDFNGDISKWDVSNVKDMSSIFHNCYKIDVDLSYWVLNDACLDDEDLFAYSNYEYDNYDKLPKNYVAYWDI